MLAVCALGMLALLSQAAQAQTTFVGSNDWATGVTTYDSLRHQIKSIFVPPPPVAGGNYRLRIVSSGWYTGGARTCYMQVGIRRSDNSHVDVGPWLQLNGYQMTTNTQNFVDWRDFTNVGNLSYYADVLAYIPGQNNSSPNPSTVWNGTFEVYWDRLP